MKVLHLTDHYPPAMGGIETHVAALAHRQALRGDDVTVVTSTPEWADGRGSIDVGPVTVKRMHNRRAALDLDVGGYDLVHVHISVVAPFSAPVAAAWSRRGVPTVVTAHSLWNGLGPLPSMAAAVAGLRSAPVRWTAVSQVAAEQLARGLPAGTPVSVLPNAVSVPPRAETPLRRAAEPVRIVSTMRVARRKRPLPLLRVFDQVRRIVEVPTTLTVVGDGPLRARFEREASRRGLDDLVTVTGRVDPPQVQELLAESDLYVAPAVLESFGLAALEARCVGLPVVGRAGTGMRDFIDEGVEGMLCPSDSAVAERVADLVADPALRFRVAEHNRTTATSMTWAHAMLRHDDVYAAARTPLAATARGRTARGRTALGG